MKQKLSWYRTAVTWNYGIKIKATHSIHYADSVVVVVVASYSLLCSRPRVVSSGLLRDAEAASCFAACALRPRWLSPPPLRCFTGAAGVAALSAGAVAAEVVSAATDAAGGSSPGGEVAPVVEAGAGGADEVASAWTEETTRAATPSSTSTTRISVTVLVLAGLGRAGGAGFFARPALAIIFCITARRYLAASAVLRIAGES